MHNLIEFLKRYNYVFLFILLEILSIWMVSRSSFYQSARIISCGNAIAGRWYSGISAITNYFGLKAENDRLAAENAQLRAQQAASYISYSDSIFEVSDTIYRQQYSYVDAKVIKSSWSQKGNYLMINKGSDHGIEPDMAVIAPQGIVGVVVNTTRNFATIMPVIHPNSSHSVKIKRSDLTGTLIWEGGDYRYATVIDIPTTHKLYKHDTIVTSGFANDFPEGIPVGYIEQADVQEGNGFYHIRLLLATDFVNLDHVYVINNHFKREQDQLIKETEASIEEQ